MPIDGAMFAKVVEDVLDIKNELCGIASKVDKHAM